MNPWLIAAIALLAVLALPGLYFLAKAAAPGLRYCDPHDLRRAFLLLGPALWLGGVLEFMFGEQSWCCGRYSNMPPELAAVILILVGFALVIPALVSNDNNLIEGAESWNKNLEDQIIDNANARNNKPKK